MPRARHLSLSRVPTYRSRARATRSARFSETASRTRGRRADTRRSRCAPVSGHHTSRSQANRVALQAVRTRIIKLTQIYVGYRTYQISLRTVLWVRIRIQHFKWIRIRLQIWYGSSPDLCFDDQKLKKTFS